MPGIPRKWQNGARLGGVAGCCSKVELRLFRKCGRMVSKFGHKKGTMRLKCLLSSVKVVIINLRGQEVCNLFDQHCEPGGIELIWNGKDQFGKFVSSGTYFVRVRSGDSIAVEKITLAK